MDEEQHLIMLTVNMNVIKWCYDMINRHNRKPYCQLFRAVYDIQGRL